MADEVSIVFEPAGEDVFRPVRVEEEVEGHLRRARVDLSHITIESVPDDDGPLYRIKVRGDDDVTGHAGGALFFYLKRRPEDRGDRRSTVDAEVRGHITPPQDRRGLG